MKITLPLLFAITVLTITNLAAKTANPPADPGWPRQRTNEQGRLVYYQPQVDAWTNFKELSFRMAFSLTPKGGKEIVGVVEVQAQTDVNMDDRSVLIRDFKIKEVKLPGLDPEKTSQVDQAVRSFLPPDHTAVMALDRLVASVEKTQAPATVQVQNDPPKIFVSYTPAILLDIDGEPTRAEIADTNMGFVVNSNFPLFFEKGGANYLFTGEQWLKSPILEGPWAPVANLPKDMTKVANDPQWAQMKKPILSPSAKGKPPTIFYSNKPAEVILFQGQPNYANIPGTQLTVATNTDADLFVYTPTQAYYYLAAGRWFKASDLKGPWTYTTPDLPPDFANIPENSPAGRVLVSVPGTDDAKDAVLMAQVPTTATVDPKAAEQAKVTYTGDPEFKPIEGTSMQYATNTADKVIKVGDVYYLCLQGVWFMSPSATGPWTTANSVPKEIYTIPPSSPVYNVTYVTQSTTPEGTVQSSYTAGYLGTFIAGAAVGAILASGTGYYYPPYYGYPVGGYPIYRPYAATYGVGAYYNTYTRRLRSGKRAFTDLTAGPRPAPPTILTPERTRAVLPLTVRTEAGVWPRHTILILAHTLRLTKVRTPTVHGDNPSSLMATNRPIRSITPMRMAPLDRFKAHREELPPALLPSTGTRAVAKTSSGNMYATHDGNVYKNTGNGWSSYDNGNWNSVNSSKNAQQQAQNYQKSGSSSSNQAAAQQRAQSSERSGQSAQSRSSGSSEVDREAQNRERGASQSQRFSDCQQRGGGGERFGGGGVNVLARGRRTALAVAGVDDKRSQLG